MTRELPDWQPFDPAGGSVSTSPAPSEEAEGRVVIVAPTASVERGGWAGRAAVALARQWGQAGTKVFLADLAVRRPILHEVVGVDNGEGITDALLYGTSIRRIAVSTGEPFFFAPAGTVVADPEPILSHDRWEVLTRGFAGAGVTLLLYAPLELPGTASLLERASEVVLLATESEASGAELEGADDKVTLVLGPEGELPTEPESDAVPEPPYGESDVAAETALDRPEGEEPTTAPAPTEAPPESAGPPVGEPPAVAEPAPPEKKTKRRPVKDRSSRVAVLVLVLVLILGGAVLGAYYGYVEVPWLTPYLEQLDGGGSPGGESPGEASSTQPGAP